MKKLFKISQSKCVYKYRTTTERLCIYKMSEKTVAPSQGLVRDLINWSQYRQTDWELPNVDLVSCEQCSPLSLVEIQPGSALIGREVQSVALAVILCHKEPA